MEEDVVIFGYDNFDLNQDDSSDDEIGASSKVIIREGSNFLYYQTTTLKWQKRSRIKRLCVLSQIPRV